MFGSVSARCRSGRAVWSGRRPAGSGEGGVDAGEAGDVGHEPAGVLELEAVPGVGVDDQLGVRDVLGQQAGVEPLQRSAGRAASQCRSRRCAVSGGSAGCVAAGLLADHPAAGRF
jgi:hypothetical protein